MKILPIQVTSSRAQQHAGGRIINNGRCPLPRHSGYRGSSCHPEKQGYASWACLVQRIAILGTSSIRDAFEQGAKRLLASPPWLNCRPVILSLSFLLFGPVALYAQDVWQGPTSDSRWSTPQNWTAGAPPMSTTTITSAILLIASGSAIPVSGSKHTARTTSIAMNEGTSAASFAICIRSASEDFEKSNQRKTAMTITNERSGARNFHSSVAKGDNSFVKVSIWRWASS
jgi:hypothetical protein